MKCDLRHWYVLGTTLLALGLGSAPMNGAETDLSRQIDALRGIKPEKDEAALAALNARMDGAWTYLRTHKTEALPLLREALAKEVAAREPDQFFLLDMGHLLLTLDGKGAETLALQALAKIDPKADIIRSNDVELFDFTHAVAKLGSMEVLAQIDRLYLSGTTGLTIFRAPHVVKLDATLICVFLFGVSGLSAEQHLVEIVEKDPTARHRALEVLGWIGSEQGTPRLGKLLADTSDYETWTRLAGVLLRVGGPAGREAVLAISPNRLDARAREYFLRIKPELGKLDAAELKKTVAQMDAPAGKSFTDAQLRKKIEQIIAADGVDEELNPSTVLNSKLPREELLDLLRRIRAATLRRVTQHVLDEVVVGNTVLNALQYQK